MKPKNEEQPSNVERNVREKRKVVVVEERELIEDESELESKNKTEKSPKQQTNSFVPLEYLELEMQRSKTLEKSNPIPSILDFPPLNNTQQLIPPSFVPTNGVAKKFQMSVLPKFGEKSKNFCGELESLGSAKPKRKRKKQDLSS